MVYRSAARYGLVCLLALGVVSCAKDSKSEKPTATIVVSDKANDIEAALRQEVESMIASAPSAMDNSLGEFVRKKPYFLKEYGIYPEGSKSYSLLITETESRTATHVASVRLAKIRFATEASRRKDEARADDNFLRETGTETRSYEYHNGRWNLLGSFFVVKKTEENVNGEWVPVERQVAPASAIDEEDAGQGWWKRAWSRITGRFRGQE
ncbi:MAG TPA: hypothetical protein PLO37_01310 [Candidatus Hydrogenedentes bacterium]|nr:hypothetical protein [Candidatus Hydrogenedentota bacterium]HPG65454.1 hypothetical protein [Candidatus Hydrogenedentota bacterium]